MEGLVEYVHLQILGPPVNRQRWESSKGGSLLTWKYKIARQGTSGRLETTYVRQHP